MVQPLKTATFVLPKIRFLSVAALPLAADIANLRKQG
jgi:hypothetical protein